MGIGVYTAICFVVLIGGSERERERERERGGERDRGRER